MRAGLHKIDLEDLNNWVFQRADIEDDEIRKLADSIEEKELIEPIVVRKTEGDGVEGVAGYRRFLACKMKGKEKIPAIVRDYTQDEALGVMIDENSEALRKDFSDNDKLRLIKVAQELNPEATQEELGDMLGVSQKWISAYLKLEKDTETIQDAVRSGDITEKKARHIRKLPEEEQKEAVSKAKGMTVRQTKDFVEEEETAKAKKRLQEQIQEQQEKLTKIQEAKERKEEIAKEKESVRKRDKELTEKLQGEIKEKLNLVEDIQHKYHDRQQDLEALTSELEQVKEEVEETDIEQLKEEREEAITTREEAKDEVAELEEKLKEARDRRDKWERVRIEKGKAIRNAEGKIKELEELKDKVAKTKKSLRKFEKKHDEEISQFDEIKQEVEEEAKEIAEEKEDLFEREQELIAEGRSVQGKINNEGAVKDKLKELQVELEAVEA